MPLPSVSVPGLVIRPATPDDLPVILQFIRDLAEFEKLSHQVTATLEDLQNGLFGERHSAEAVIAEAAGKTVGYALFFTSFSTFQGRAGIYLEDLYVQPASRGQGIGKALLCAVGQIAASRNCGRYEWSVLDWNVSAIEFYTRLGAEMQPDWRRMKVEGPELAALASLQAKSP